MAVKVGADDGAAVGGHGEGANAVASDVHHVDDPDGIGLGAVAGAQDVIDAVKADVGFLSFLFGDGKGAGGVEVELLEIDQCTGGRAAVSANGGVLGDDLAVGHVEFPDSATGGGIVEDDSPERGLRDAAVAFDFNDVLEQIVAALPADDAEGLVGCIRAVGKEREGRNDCKGCEKKRLHGRKLKES